MLSKMEVILKVSASAPAFYSAVHLTDCVPRHPRHRAHRLRRARGRGHRRRQLGISAGRRTHRHPHPGYHSTRENACPCRQRWGWQWGWQGRPRSSPNRLQLQRQDIDQIERCPSQVEDLGSLAPRARRGRTQRSDGLTLMEFKHGILRWALISFGLVFNHGLGIGIIA